MVDGRSRPLTLVEARTVLIVDDEGTPISARSIRTLLMTIGVRHIQEASNGYAGLDTIRTFNPDIVLVDWEMPELDGPSFVRAVRSPETFPHPDVPIIMLTGA